MAEKNEGFQVSPQLLAKHSKRIAQAVSRSLGRPLDESEALMVRAYAEVTCKFFTAIALKIVAAEIARIATEEAKENENGEA